MGTMELEDDKERAEWGLRCYVNQVALGLGIGLESACCEVASPASAYLAVDQRLSEFPGRDAALFWDAVHGWAVGGETGSGEDLVMVAYLGGEHVLADPEAVVTFAKTVLDGHVTGQRRPPFLACDDLTSKLAAYAPAAVA